MPSDLNCFTPCDCGAGDPHTMLQCEQRDVAERLRLMPAMFRNGVHWYPSGQADVLCVLGADEIDRLRNGTKLVRRDLRGTAGHFTAGESYDCWRRYDHPEEPHALAAYRAGFAAAIEHVIAISLPANGSAEQPDRR